MKLSSEEAEAILEGGGEGRESRAPSVSARDFRRPCRLSRSERQGLYKALCAALPELERALMAWLRAGFAIELEDVTEVGAVGLFEGLEDPLAVQELRCSGRQGWMVLTNAAAQALAHMALGAQDPGAECPPRRLRPIEVGLIGDVLAEVAGGIARALGVELELGPLMQDERALRTSLDPDLALEPQRFAIHLGLSGPSLPSSTLRIYLPEVFPKGRAPAAGPAAARPLPLHLRSVPVDLSAQLGSIEVPLSDLLSLEVGDVVPLGVDEGAPATIFVDTHACGSAQWGGHEGGLALRVLDFRPPEEDER